MTEGRWNQDLFDSNPFNMNALAIWIKVLHVHSANPFEDWCLEKTEMMLELFDSIHWTAFLLIKYLSKSE